MVLKPINFILLMQFVEASYLVVATMKTFNRIALGYTYICSMKYTLKINQYVYRHNYTERLSSTKSCRRLKRLHCSLHCLTTIISNWSMATYYCLIRTALAGSRNRGAL